MRRLFRTEEHEVSLVRPVWFRPFINWHGLKLVGMVLFALSQLITMVEINNRFFADSIVINETLKEFLKGISVLALPLMMIAVFSRIVTDEQHIKRKLYTYFCLAFAFYILEILAVHAFVYQSLGILQLDAESLVIFAEILVRFVLAPFAGINVFLDFFVCTLFYYFLTYTPKGYTGVRLTLFRLGTLLPVLYILISFVLSGLLRLGVIGLDFYTVALLPSKNLAVYLIFFLMVLYRRSHSLYGGSAASEKKPFRSDSFSVFLALMLTLISAADYLLALLPYVSSFGIGNASTFFLAAPLVLCFDCEKPLRKKYAPLIYDTAFYLILYIVLLYFYSKIFGFVITMLTLFMGEV